MERIGQYELRSKIGEGGMGEVWRAHDFKRKRDVALKLLPEALSRDPEYQQRFRRESYVLARLREPHVVPIHDYGEIDGRLFIDMRLVDGQSLGDLLEDGPLAAERTTRLVDQIAEALDAAHADGLVHRDIKPSNVLVARNDFVYVVDFGLAYSVGQTRPKLTMTGTTLGTLDYMAPERFVGRAVDARTDVYSVACLIFECLTGAKPFTGDFPSQMYGHLNLAPPAPSGQRDGVPAGFDEVVARGMAKDPDDRYATVGELAAAARAAITASPVPATTPPEPVAATGATAVVTAHTVVVPVEPSSAPVADRADTTSAVALLEPASAAPGGAVVTDPARAAAPTAPARDPHPSGPTPAGPLPPLSAGPAAATGPSDSNPWFLPTVEAPTSQQRPSQQSHQPPPVAPPAAPVPAPSATPPSATSTRGRVLVLAALAVAAIVAVTVVLLVPLVPGGGSSSTASPGAPLGPLGAASAKPASSVPSPTVSATVPVGPTPGYMEIAPDGRFAYIANRGARVLTVFDTTRNVPTGTIPVPEGGPQFVAFSPDGSRAYVSVFNTDFSLNEVAVVDTAEGAVVARVPTGKRPFALDVSPDGERVYVPNHDSGDITVIATDTNTVVNTIRVAPNPHWLDFSPDGTRLYAANHESNVISVIDTGSDRVLGTTAVGKAPHSIVWHPTNQRIYNANYDDSSVSVTDAQTGRVIATVPTASHPQDITLSADGRYAYLATVDANSIQVLDTTTFAVTATVPTGRGPTSVAVAPNGRQAYVTNLLDGSVTVLNAAGAA